MLQGESYQLIMYNAARGVGKASIVFFVTLIVFGQIILLKLFLAVMLDNFEDKRKELEELMKSQRRKSLKTRVKEGLLDFQKMYGCCCCKRSESYVLKQPTLN